MVCISTVFEVDSGVRLGGADISGAGGLRDTRRGVPAAPRAAGSSACGMFARTSSGLTRSPTPAHLSSMKIAKARWCWRKDLSEFRGLTDQERTGFLLVLEWFENFRMRQDMEAGRAAARAFWKHEVLRED